MNPSLATRRSYDRNPYPGDDVRELAKAPGSLPSPKWMQALGRPGRESPRRILVAGCGSGPEAFQLRRHFPKAEIVAVDFSAASIALANRLQEFLAPTRPIAFAVADLADPKLARITGRDFDLVTCHGVLSYIRAAGRAMGHLARVMAPGGTLYLGVNGEGHPSARLRPWLASFGLDVGAMRDERRLRGLLGIWDALRDDGMTGLAGMSANYLANDVCGPLIHCLPLARWRTDASAHGLEFAGAWLLPMALRLAMDGGRWRPLFPAGLGDLAERLDGVRPAGFHRLLFRKPGPGTAGESPRGGTGETRGVVWTGLYSVRFKPARAKGRVTATLDSRVLDLRFDETLTHGQADALRALMISREVPAAWKARFGRNEAARGILWLWAGLGVVAPAAVPEAA